MNDDIIIGFDFLEVYYGIVNFNNKIFFLNGCLVFIEFSKDEELFVRWIFRVILFFSWVIFFNIILNILVILE